HHRLLVIFLVAVLALVYVLGTSREYRRYRSDTSATGNLPTSTGTAAPKLMVWGWLAVITLLWLVLLIFSPAFVWVAFPLMFLYLYLLATFSARIALVVVWGWLALITRLCLVLSICSPALVWVASPLMFLYLYLLGTISGVIAVVLLWAAT